MRAFEFRWTLGFLFVALGATLAEVPVLLELLEAQPEWPIVIRLHALSIGATVIYAGLYTYARWRPQRSAALEPRLRVAELRRRIAGRIFWAWYLVFATSLFGVFGAGGTFAAFGLYLHHARHSRPFEEWYKELFPERGRRIYERIYDELMLTARQRESQSEVVPFSDVVNYGSREQKQLAISMMSRYFAPAFAPVLKHALEDSNNAVRIQAATAITNVESRFAERAMTLEQQASRDPAPRHLLELARHLDRYAFSGLLDADRTRRLRERATEYYFRYLEDEPGDLFARIAIGRLLLRGGEHERARDWLLAARDRHGGHPSLDNWLLEAHYRVGDYTAVRALASTIAGGDNNHDVDVLSDSARMWAGVKPAREAAL